MGRCSNVRVPKYEFYWRVAKNPFDKIPVYKVRETHSAYDQSAWDDGSYFLTRAEALREIADRRARAIRKIKAKKS